MQYLATKKHADELLSLVEVLGEENFWWKENLVVMQDIAYQYERILLFIFIFLNFNKIFLIFQGIWLNIFADRYLVTPDAYFAIICFQSFTSLFVAILGKVIRFADLIVTD